MPAVWPDVMNRIKLIAIVAIVAIVVIAIRRRGGGVEDDFEDFE